MAEENSDQQSAASMKFPRDKNQYIITAAATPDSAGVAKHVNPTTGEEIPVGIKIFNTYKIEDIYTFTTELHEAETFDHENLIKVHCSFTFKAQLWIIMSLPGFSMRSVIQSSFRQGLPEKTVACILKETLKALNYFHGKNKVHGNINGGCIFLDENSRVNLVYDSLMYEDHRSKKSSNLVTIAPELMNDYGSGRNKATDIWMFGLLALELYYGRVPADFDEFQLLINGIESGFGMILKKQENHNNQDFGILGKFRVFSCFHDEERQKIPKLLREVMAACLSMDPDKRPTTNQLMEFELFQTRVEDNRSLQKLMKKACKDR